MNGVLGRLASTSQELAHYHSGEGILRLLSPSFDLSFIILIALNALYLHAEL